MPALSDVVALVEEWYPPERAEDWDRVGLVCGDPEADVRRVLLAVDPVLAVADEAVAWEADLVITHHPLYLRGTSSVAATTPKGRVVHRLVTHGCGLLAAHTNADAPAGGVSEAMALALGLVEVRPLEADSLEPRDKLVVFAPTGDAAKVRDAITAAGAGAIGDYDSCTFTTAGEGRFRPLPGANPTIGAVGDLETVEEVRIEAILDRRLRGRVVAAMLDAHPYEEPAYDVVPLASLEDPTRGSGRLGRLPEPMSLAEFAARVADRLPATAHGVRVAGDRTATVETVAMCGGSGDFLLDRARAVGADAYVTSDLRHHPASELREHPDAPALLDVAHWAAEWTWLPVLRARLVEALGDTVTVHVSTTNTDPWTFRV
ncbi:MAG TPA: Nif3-like dinuclear metal center hexameric protein [Marmoricola sp.]|nr:Nif3-like dinuclear metal center hexameric protein [Marmoricola sp.]